MGRGTVNAFARGAVVAGRGDDEDARGPQGGHCRLQGVSVTPLLRWATPRVVENVRAEVGAAVGQRVARLWKGGQQKLEAVEVARRVAQVARQVDAGDPGRVGGHADASADGRTQGVRAVAAAVAWRGRVVPRVEPVVVVTGRAAGGVAAILVAQFGVRSVHTGVALADDDARAGDTQLLPDERRVDALL